MERVLSLMLNQKEAANINGFFQIMDDYVTINIIYGSEGGEKPLKTIPTNTFFFPPRLKTALKSILSYPLTLITAGSGFGKTTAVSCFLDKLRQDTVCHWYTCFGEPPERAWSGICTLLSFADPYTGDFLSKITSPTLDNLGSIALLMDGLSCDKETILVVDNYQLAEFPAPSRLLEALAAHHCRRLHLVVLTQPLCTEKVSTVSNPHIGQIFQDVFNFQTEDIRKLFEKNGVGICAREAARLYELTGGWVAALRLHLSQYMESGRLSEQVGIDELMERSFWGALDDSQRCFFLGLSLLDTFTEAQAARISGQKTVPDALWTIVRRNPLVHREGAEYILHGLLKEYLSAKMLARDADFRKMMWDRAGDACSVQGKNVEAVLFFILSGNDEAALGVTLNSLQLAELVRTKTDRLNALLFRCSVELLADKWQLLLGSAIKASLNGKITLARTAIARMMQLREFPGGSQQKSVEAALELIASFQAFNDVAGMCRHHAAVYGLLDDPSDFYLTNDSWTFGVPSVVYMFWRESGELAKTIRLVKEGVPRYAVIGGGKGLGAPEVMLAEAHLLSGDEEGCKTFSSQAKFIAAEHGQDSIYFCALTLTARRALLRGDAECFSAAVKAIERHAFEGKEFRCVTAAEVCLGYVYFVLDIEEKIPQWLFRKDAIGRQLYPVSIPFAYIIALRWLRRHKRDEFAGAAEVFLQESKARHHLLPMLYIWLEQAACYEEDGSRVMARERVQLALTHAFPDEVYLPIAEYYTNLSGVLEDPALSCKDETALERVRALGRRFVSGTAAVRAELFGYSPLTSREREIALLAKERLSTREIAERLVISPATVKNTLNKIYSKLNIHGKSDLLNIRF